MSIRVLLGARKSSDEDISNQGGLGFGSPDIIFFQILQVFHDSAADTL